jgi:hypothetical protein
VKHTLAKTAAEKVERINIIAQRCYYGTESWEHRNFGMDLAYLFWAITDNTCVTHRADSPFIQKLKLCRAYSLALPYLEIVSV